MKTGRWVQNINISGTSYRAEFVKRPFREGLEIRVELPNEVITVAEMGLGENALLERVKAMVEERLKMHEPDQSGDET